MRDGKELSKHVKWRPPGHLPRSHVGQDELQLVKQVPELKAEEGKDSSEKTTDTRGGGRVKVTYSGEGAAKPLLSLLVLPSLVLQARQPYWEILKQHQDDLRGSRPQVNDSGQWVRLLPLLEDHSQFALPAFRLGLLGESHIETCHQGHCST